MTDVSKVSVKPLNAGESKALKAAVYDLSELAAKQTLYGMIQILCIKVHVPMSVFKEILDDARKYDEVKGKKP